MNSNQANTRKTKAQAIQATTTSKLRSPSLTNQQINFSQQPLNLTKKRKIDSDISGSDNNTKVIIESPRTNNSSEDLIKDTSSDKMAISNANETSNNDINWCDMACPINCLKCKSENLIPSEETKFTCSECYTEQNIVRFCCTDDISNRFAVERQQLHVLCKQCQSPMVKLPCCNTFQPQFMTEDKLYTCLSCDRCSFNCICGTINTLPLKPMRKNCSNGKCPYHVIHCDCNKKTCY